MKDLPANEQRIVTEINDALDSTDVKAIQQAMDRYGGLLCKHRLSVSDAQQRLLNHLARRLARKNALIESQNIMIGRLTDALDEK